MTINRRNPMFSNWVVGILVLGLFSLVAVQSALGLPNFARRYSAACAMCHTTPPHLNAVGYNFRRAGYRLPGEIGQEIKPDLSHLYAVRGQLLYTTSYLDTAGQKFGAHSEFAFGEANLHPATGAFLNNWSSGFELTFTGVDAPSVEVENAYARYSYGNQERFLTVRAGQMKPFEGYGASDRPLGNFWPLIEVFTPAHNGAGSGHQLQDQSQLALELGGTWKTSTLSVAALNGYMKAIQGDTDERRDVAVVANQLIGETGGGVNAYFYKGSVDLPASFITGASFKDDYNRLAVFANFPVFKLLTKSPYLSGVDLMAGYEKGKDKYDTLDASGNLVLQDFGSGGYFGEVQWPIAKHLTWQGRYDKFDPDDKVDHNEWTGLTTTFVFPFENIRFYLEAQQLTIKQPAFATVTQPDLKTTQANAMIRFAF